MRALFLAALVASLSACELTNVAGTTPAPTKPADLFEVHVQGWYDETPVRVELDGEVILDEAVSTGAILAYAAIVPAGVAQGEHRLRAVVDGVAEGDTTVVVGDTLYVTVNYDPQARRIRFSTQTHPFGYR